MKKKILPIVAVILAAAALMWFFTALGQLSAGQKEEGRRQLETALRKAAVACYAAEGAYPESLEYLMAHYGVQINAEVYVVHYRVFGENLMPDITVLIKGS